MSLAIAVLAAFVLGVLLPLAGAHRLLGTASWVLSLLGCLGGVVLGARAIAGGRWALQAGNVVSPVPGLHGGTSMSLDPLSGLFLVIICAVGLPATLVGLSWWSRTPDVPLVPAPVSLLFLACFLVVAAADVWVLIVGWELVTLAFFWLTGSQRRRPGRVAAALATVGFGKVSGACLTAGLLLLVASSRSVDLDGLGAAHGAPRVVGYALLLVAFAVKVGLVPLHVWLPRSYAAAPGPVRALMAGAAVNVGFYGMWRTLDLLGAPPAWLADVVMVTGGVSAIIGIAHASVQNRLTRIIAYSSIENAGLIVAAYGVALVGASTHSPGLLAAGLLAGTLQVIGHAIAKTLLFSSAGVIAAELDSDEMSELRGVARLFPWSGTGLAVGAATIAGLPPGVVFVSEWFILETLMQQFRLSGRLEFALPLAFTSALVALTTGFATVAFLRVIAFTVLGRTPAHRWERQKPRDVGWPGRVGLLTLMLACVGVAAASPYEIAVLARGLDPIVPGSVTNGAVTGTTLGPVFADFSVLDPTWLVLELPVLLIVVGVVAYLLSRRRMWTVRVVEPWRSATGGVSGADEYTAFGYANPTRHVLANVLQPSTELRELTADERDDTGAVLGFRADVVELSEAYLYRPLRRLLDLVVAGALKIQNGRLDAYLLYLLVTVIAVITLVGVLG